MAKFKDTVYKIFGLETVDDDPIEESAETAEPTKTSQASARTPGKYTGTYSASMTREPQARNTRVSSSPYTSGSASFASSRPSMDASSYRSTPRTKPESSTPLYPLASGSASSAQENAIQMIVYQLQSYDDTQRVVDELRSGHTVIVSTERLKTEIAQRALDFIGGAIYAINGNHRKIARGIFVFAPESVDISGNYSNILPAEMRTSR